MSVETLLFLVLLLQIALMVVLHRIERRTRDAISRAQTQNARWLSDVSESLRREIRQGAALAARVPAKSPTRERDEPDYDEPDYDEPDYRERERSQFWESVSED